jgi:periplasmic protein TonB
MVERRSIPAELKLFGVGLLLLSVLLAGLTLVRLWRFDTIPTTAMKPVPPRTPRIRAADENDVRWAPSTRYEGLRPPGTVIGPLHSIGVLREGAGAAPGNAGFGPGALFRRGALDGGLAPGSGLMGGPTPVPPPPPPPHARRPDKVKRIRLAENFARAKLIRRPEPKYPALARQAGIQGTVQEARLVEGHPLLVPAAIDAVMKWLFMPTLLNGEPVGVKAPITIVFDLP